MASGSNNGVVDRVGAQKLELSEPAGGAPQWHDAPDSSARTELPPPCYLGEADRHSAPVLRPGWDANVSPRCVQFCVQCASGRAGKVHANRVVRVRGPCGRGEARRERG